MVLSERENVGWLVGITKMLTLTFLIDKIQLGECMIRVYQLTDKLKAKCCVEVRGTHFGVVVFWKLMIAMLLERNSYINPSKKCRILILFSYGIRVACIQVTSLNERKTSVSNWFQLSVEFIYPISLIFVRSLCSRHFHFLQQVEPVFMLVFCCRTFC